MSDWFENWFESEEYLNVYSHRNNEDAKKLFDLIMANIKLPDNASILDLACGAGRHSILFAKKGYQVTSVDLSQNLLNIARKSAEAEDVSLNIVRCDMRKFSSSNKFNLTLNLFTSFGYFESDKENFEIFDVVYSSLKDKGYFVFDYLNKNYVEKNIIPEDIKVSNGATITQQRKISEGRVIKNIVINKGSKEISFFESVKLYSCDELVNELVKRDFTIMKTFGDLNGNPIGENSDRVIIILKK